MPEFHSFYSYAESNLLFCSLGIDFFLGGGSTIKLITEMILQYLKPFFHDEE